MSTLTGIRVQLPTVTLAELRTLAATLNTSVAELVRASVDASLAQLRAQATRTPPDPQ